MDLAPPSPPFAAITSPPPPPPPPPATTTIKPITVTFPVGATFSYSTPLTLYSLHADHISLRTTSHCPGSETLTLECPRGSMQLKFQPQLVPKGEYEDSVVFKAVLNELKVTKDVRDATGPLTIQASTVDTEWRGSAQAHVSQLIVVYTEGASIKTVKIEGRAHGLRYWGDMHWSLMWLVKRQAEEERFVKALMGKRRKAKKKGMQLR